MVRITLTTSTMAARAVQDQEVELGFLEIPENLQLLTSPHFPRKVGGKAAWLDLTQLPSPDELACGSCRKPVTFLLQIYAPVPVDESKPDGAEYPRTLFVFMCRDARCHCHGTSRCFRVFRCQLEAGTDAPNLNTDTSGTNREFLDQCPENEMLSQKSY